MCIKALEEYRLEHKLSQKKIADLLDVSFQTVWRWFNDKSEPSKIQKHGIKKLLNGENYANRNL